MIKIETLMKGCEFFMKKLIMIVNPNAGKRRLLRYIPQIVSYFSENGCSVTTYYTKKKGDAAEICAKTAKNYDLVVCCGGDGTLNEVVSGLMLLPSCPPVGYIPAGTTNDLAGSLCIPKHPLSAAQAILKGTAYPYDVGALNGKSFNYIAAFGAFTSTSYSTPQKMKNVLGHLAYVLQGIREIPEIQSHHVTVDYDGKTEQGEFVYGAVTNSTSIAGIMGYPNESVSLNDGKFEVMLIRKPASPRALHKTIYALNRKRYDPNYTLFFHASRLKITFDRPLAWTLDGEKGGIFQSADISNLHRAVSFLADVSKIPTEKARKNQLLSFRNDDPVRVR